MRVVVVVAAAAAAGRGASVASGRETSDVA